MQNSVSLADSRKTVLENTIFLNDNVVSPISVDASMTKSSRKRYAINNHFSQSTQDLGKFNDSKLSTLYQSSYQQDQRGQVIYLASFDRTRGNQLSISSQANKLFKKYQKNAITFLSNMGKKESGKSFWYDKILNLSQVDGAQYSKIRQTPGLYIWSIPFVKNNLRIFMIDWIGHSQDDKLSGEDEKLLDLQILLSQVLILVPNWEDKKLKIRDVVYSNLNSSMSRLTEGGSKTNKDAEYWPHSMYCLYRSIKAINTDTDILTYLFKNYSYSLIQDALNSKISQKASQLSLMKSSLLKDDTSSSLLSQKYVKRTSLIFQDIYKKLKGKKYLSVSFTGQTLPYILKHFSKNLNSSNRTIKVDKMFNDIKIEIYQRKLDSAKFIYNLNYDPLKADSDNLEILRNSKKTERKSKKNLQNSKRYLDNSRMTDSIENVRTDNHLIIIEEEPSISDNNNILQHSTKNYLDQSTKINNPQNISESVNKARSLDEVIEIFRVTNENVLKDFNETNYDQEMHQKYEKKILQYGEMKEKQVLNSNKMQTHQILNNSLPLFTQPKEQAQLQPRIVLDYLNQLKRSNSQLNHNRSIPIATRLKDIASHAKQYRFFNVWETEAYHKQRKLQMGLDDKRKELYKLKSKQQHVLLAKVHQENIAEQVLDQLNRSTDKVQQTKDELNRSQKLNKNEINEQDYLKELKNHKKILDEIFSKNQKIIKQLSIDVSAIGDPRITLLEQKLDDKKTVQLQVQAGISNLMQSKLNNSASLLSSRRSQIRKINGTQIKKSHLNKSMTK